MKRYPLKFRVAAYNECDFYQLMPVARRAVAPGERISKLVVDIRFASAIYEKANMTPVLVQTWAFYVPHRLVWDQWVDFIALDDAVTAPPTTTIAAPKYFEIGSATKSSLFRRAYKLMYNQYFGDETQGAGAWFANTSDDTDVSLGRLLIWDQYRSHLRAGTYTQNSFTASVSGATATIPLDDLARAIRSNHARRRQKMTGDKYVDTMRLMGVELDWRVQMAPEFLGSSQQVVMGTVQQSAASTDLATRATCWEGIQQLVVRRRLAFAEHGHLIVVAGFRPLVAHSGSSALDAGFVQQGSYFRPDMQGGPFDPSGATGQAEHYGPYLKGRNMAGSNENGLIFMDASSAATVLYPDPAQFAPMSGSGPRAMACQVDMSVSGLTPVPALRA